MTSNYNSTISSTKQYSGHMFRQGIGTFCVLLILVCLASSSALATSYPTDINCRILEMTTGMANLMPTTFTAPADLCENAGMQTGLGGGLPVGGVYSGPGVSDDGNGTSFAFDPAIAGVGLHSLTYTFTDVNGAAMSAVDLLEVFALPTVTFTAPADLCEDAETQTGLGGGLPVGGVYSGPGVSDDGNGMTYAFDPATAEVGVHSLTYTYVPNFPQVGLDINGEATGDESGASVSMSSDGKRVAIGASFNDDGGSNAGQVRIYEWSGATWVQLGLDIDGEAAGDRSGFSVSLSADGNRVAIGAFGNSGAAGQVRIYAWNGAAWIQVGLDIDGEAGDAAGYSVSLSSNGSRVAIGAIGNSTSRIFEWNGTEWGQVGLDIVDEIAGGFSGWSVVLSSDGNRVAIGAPRNNGGHVRIYDWNGSAWVQVGLDIDGEATGDRSGESVSLSADGNRVAIGAPINGAAGITAGQVRIYDWNGSAWVQVGLDIDGGTAGDLSGSSVSISSDGNRVVIGAPGNGGGGINTGQVRIFDWNGSAWVQAGLVIAGEAADNRSGSSVSISSDGNRVAIGAPGNGNVETNSGQVRIFDWSGSAWVQVGLDIDGETAGDRSGTSVSLSSDGNRVAIGAPHTAGAGGRRGHVRIYNTAIGICPNSASDDVEVFALPTAAFTAPADLCEDAGIQPGLGGGTPTGGVYSGTGVADDGNGTTYSFDPAAAGAGIHSITYDFTNSNGCSESAADDVEVFALLPGGECPSFLPVELTAFVGRTAGKQNILEWTTASEEAFSHYELERSPGDAANWEMLGAVAGAGQVGLAQDYTYTDVAPTNSSYYRLRMVDLDGSFIYSNIVHLEQTTAARELVVYPNPNNGQFTVQLPTDESAILTLYDLNGRIVWQRKASSEVSVASLPDGVYLLSATTPSNRWTKRVVVR